MSTALCTDRYELTMLDAAIRSDVVDTPVVFEAFTRSLSRGSWAVMAGNAAVVESICEFQFGPSEIDFLRTLGAFAPATLEYLRTYRFRGSMRALPEGELFVAGTPLLNTSGTFGDCIVLETIVLSALNAGIGVATEAVRTRLAAGPDVPLIEMGSRRVHHAAAVDAARAAWIGGVDATSNLEAGRRFGIPSAGTAAHAWTLVHTSEFDTFVAQLAAAGRSTTLLVDTFDVEEGTRAAVVAARQFGWSGPAAVRIDSGDALQSSLTVRRLLDALGAADTRIIASGELDADRIAQLRQAGAPIDSYGLGTRLVLAPSPGCVYKLVARDGQPVAKRSAGKVDIAGVKQVYRQWTEQGAHDSIVVGNVEDAIDNAERLDEAVFDDGVLVGSSDPHRDTAAARARCADRLARLGEGALTAAWLTGEGGWRHG